jgi:carbon-monoxide dehydrogenase large subunit
VRWEAGGAWGPQGRRVLVAEAGISGVADATGGRHGGPLMGIGAFVPPRIVPPDEHGQTEKPKAFYTVGAQAVEVEVDRDTGEVRVLRAAHAFDLGRAINPQLAAGQVVGGAAQGLSIALFEAMRWHAGKPANAGLLDYKIATSLDVPYDVDVSLVETPQSDGPFGARGIAEPPLVGPAPALANAIRDAVGVRMTSLPMSGEPLARVLGLRTAAGRHAEGAGLS